MIKQGQICDKFPISFLNHTIYYFLPAKNWHWNYILSIPELVSLKGVCTINTIGSQNVPNMFPFKVLGLFFQFSFWLRKRRQFNVKMSTPTSSLFNSNTQLFLFQRTALSIPTHSSFYSNKQLFKKMGRAACWNGKSCAWNRKSCVLE